MAVDSVANSWTPQIAGAIRHAAHSTGISFEYLLTTAQIESNLNPSAQASTSSAKGLYQFIDQTWLGTMKQDGPALGLSRYADAISRGMDGHYEVSDPTMRAEIMRLRSDPAASAMLAGALTRANSFQLTASIGRRPSEGELYIAHFLGPDGAGKLIRAATNQPQADAAAMFPAAAAANRSIFYERSGSPRSISAVYAKLTGRFEMARAIQFAPGLRGTAAIGGAMAAAVPDTAGIPPATVPDTAGITQAYAAANDRMPPPPDTTPLFQAMFTNRARQAVTSTVSGLWAPAATTSAPSVADRPVRTLDLFTNSPTDSRQLFRGKV
jgi:hypothetical protein